MFLFPSMRRVIITWCLSRKKLIIVFVGHPSDMIMTFGQQLKVVKRDTWSTEHDNYSDCINAPVKAVCYKFLQRDIV